jgi:hypothetical protein
MQIGRINKLVKHTGFTGVVLYRDNTVFPSHQFQSLVKRLYQGNPNVIITETFASVHNKYQCN